MQQELRITFRNMDVSETLEQRIRALAAGLDHICDRITACSVVVEAHHRHPNQAKTFHVHVDLTVPGRIIVVRREPGEHHAHDDAYAAARSAFDSARRQLEDHVQVVRGEVKAHTKTPQTV